MKTLCNKKVIAASLMEWTLGSTTKFLSTQDNEILIEKAKKIGIELPSPDLAVFETIYCEVDKFNLNGVKFSKEVAEKGLKTLIGKQINWNHDGAHQICGYIIDSEIKEDKIYITGVLFKSLFIAEFDEVVQLFTGKKLFVSFELWTRKEDGTSVVKNLGNGKRELTEFIGHGCALLLIDPNTDQPIPPACPAAQVKKLLASTKTIEEAEQIINQRSEQNDNLVYAELTLEKESDNCNKCKTCTCHQLEGGLELKMEKLVLLISDYEPNCEIEDSKKLTTEQRNALPDSDFALIQEKDGKKIRRFPINDEAHVRNALARLPQATDITEEERKTALENILKKAKELNMIDLLKKYEKADERVCPECNQPMEDEEVDLCAECKKKKEPAAVEPICPTCKVGFVPEKPDVEICPECLKKKVEFSDVVAPEPSVTIVKRITEEIVVTTEIPNDKGGITEKKGYNKHTIIYSDGKEEINTEEFDVLETYSLAQLEEKISAVKAEKDIEITNLKQELDTKNQEIATLKLQTEESIEEPDLTIGNVVAKPELTETKKQADNINKIIASKHNR